ncbi:MULTISPECIES: LD-carboxypeptidase [unclassified Streptomyces]|uniref:LD-carboxypeptidase n=1 Tax=unclassified Streptomyces TaxID=2593676 RepID=UPI003322381E
MTDPLHPAKPRPGDKVAVLSPSSGLPGLLPLPYELGLRRLREEFGLKPVEYLLLFLRNAGIVGYHGGSVMVELGRPGALHPLTADSLRAALFTSGEYELTAADAFGDVNRPWEDPRTFESEPELETAGGWIWHNGGRVVEGIGWGGNLEIISWLLMADRAVLPADAYAGNVLFLETSEETPPAEQVYRILRNMGERGLLRQFPALLMGRAKAWSFENPLSGPERDVFRLRQREAVLRALRQYAPDTMAVFDVDLGHTDPQLVLPVGGRIRVDGREHRITVTY